MLAAIAVLPVTALGRASQPGARIVFYFVAGWCGGQPAGAALLLGRPLALVGMALRMAAGLGSPLLGRRGGKRPA